MVSALHSRAGVTSSAADVVIEVGCLSLYVQYIQYVPTMSHQHLGFSLLYVYEHHVEYSMGRLIEKTNE